MFKTFFLSEIKYVFRQPMLYIFFFLMALMTFFATASEQVVIGGAIGNIYKNAPHVITQFTTIMSIFGLMIATAFYNNAALKDHQHKFTEILFTTPLGKAGYYFGRFFAALFLSTIPLLGIFFGVILGTYLGPLFNMIDADRMGPLFLETFVNNYLLFIVPNMFFAGSIIFVMASKWKSTVISFVGSLVIIIAYIVAGTYMSDMDNENVAALLDSFGIRTYFLEAQYYTPFDKNTLSPSFSGLVLWNRLIWIGIGTVILLIGYFNFSFTTKNKKVSKAKKVQQTDNDLNMPAPVVATSFTKRTEWLHFKSFFYTSFLNIVKSVTFKILFLFATILLVTNLVKGFESMGLKSYPLTYKMISQISGSSGLFVIIILVFFSGELIWRDRESKIHEVIDSTSHTTFISLVAKVLSLVTVVSVIQLFLITLSIGYQLLSGFGRIELDVYFLNFIYTELPSYFLYSSIMVFIQVLFNNKYLGYFVSILVVFVSDIILSILHIETNMLSLAGRPSLQYSDLNRFGPGLKGAMWFNVYWVLLGVIFILLAGVFWNRGVVSSIKDRLKLAKKQLPSSYKKVFLGVFTLWLGVASYVYYNTQILNSYKTGKEQELISVNYEKAYKQYQDVPLPKIMDIKYVIDFYPSKRDAFAQATLLLSNQTQVPIDSIHFNTSTQWKPTFSIPNSKQVLNDKELGYAIFQLDNPMQPGDTLEIVINTEFITKGFENSRGSTGIVRNGSFVNNFTLIPGIGYQLDAELGSKHKRKKHDLPRRERMPALEANCASLCESNYLSNGRSDYINVETIVSTDGDQIAIAPGSLLKKWTKDGRNYYHYKVDHPSQNFYSFISGRYEVARKKWNDIDIEVYYDKKHAVNVDMMIAAVERSLAYYTKNFGPYYHKQCRIIEFPRYASFAQAFPGTMPYSEAIGFITNLEDETKNNIIDAIIAHEMAHQWWAHQVVGANMQGSTMLSESFAEYASLMTMKQMAKTPMQMKQFLKYDFRRYLRGRSQEQHEEKPLYKVENQQYIHYGKGSVILYALQDYIGEARVNGAMSNFLEEYRYKTPYPTSLDFLRHLEPQVPDSLQYLIQDWFKDITLYDNRLMAATGQKLPNGRYEISLDILAKKIKADSSGREINVPINDWIDIGVFKDDDKEELLYQKRVKINQEKMTFTFEVDTIPAKAAIDPRQMLIERVYRDNFKRVTID